MIFGNSEDEHDFFDLCNDLRYIDIFFNHFLYITNDRSIFLFLDSDEHVDSRNF